MDGPKPTQGVRLAAIVAGIVGFLCFISLPFLPVTQTEASLTWPQNDSLNSVDAPLMAQAPLSLSMQVPVSLAEELPEDESMLIGTVPADSKDPTAEAMQVRSTDNGIDVIFRDRVVLSVDEEQIEANPDAVITVNSTTSGRRRSSRAPSTRTASPCAASWRRTSGRRQSASTPPCPPTATRRPPWPRA